MDDSYANIHNNCKLVKIGRGSVDFLLAYSKSLQIRRIKGLYFETNLN